MNEASKSSIICGMALDYTFSDVVALCHSSGIDSTCELPVARGARLDHRGRATAETRFVVRPRLQSSPINSELYCAVTAHDYAGHAPATVKFWDIWKKK